MQLPLGQEVCSSSTENSTFILALPAPVLGGQYACAAIPSASPCPGSAPPVSRAATLVVDSLEAMVALLVSREKLTEERLQEALTDLNETRTELHLLQENVANTAG